MNRRVIALALMLAGACLAASCASDSYHAYDAREGYSEQRLEETSWRVSFVGSTVESQAAVEQQLLRRAAELTVQSGYDWFTPVGQSVQQEEGIVVTGQRPPEARADSAAAVWRPHWRRRGALRWTDWDPRGAPASDQRPPAPEPSVRSEQRFSAEADITMGRGPAPAAAFDARAVLASATPGE